MSVTPETSVEHKQLNELNFAFTGKFHNSFAYVMKKKKIIVDIGDAIFVSSVVGCCDMCAC